MSVPTLHLRASMGLATYRPGAMMILTLDEARASHGLPALPAALPCRHAVVERLGFGGGGRSR